MEDWVLKKGRIASYYASLIRLYGDGPRACDYGKVEFQNIKFRVLSEVLPLTRKSVLDVGCGFADFADFLQLHFDGVSYHGVDITPAMVEAARLRHPQLDITQKDILQNDPGGPYDLVTANGIFYLLGDDAENVMYRLIARMYDLSREAVAFNTLSLTCTDPQPGEFYADPRKTFAFCQTLTPYVRLRADVSSARFHDLHVPLDIRRNTSAKRGERNLVRIPITSSFGFALFCIAYRLFLNMDAAGFGVTVRIDPPICEKRSIFSAPSDDGLYVFSEMSIHGPSRRCLPDCPYSGTLSFGPELGR